MNFSRLLSTISVLLFIVLLTKVNRVFGRSPAVEPVFSMEAEVLPNIPITEKSMMRLNFFNPESSGITIKESYKEPKNNNVLSAIILILFTLLPVSLLISIRSKTTALSKNESIASSQSVEEKAQKIAQDIKEIASKADDSTTQENVHSLENFRTKKEDEVTEQADEDKDDSKVA